MSDHSEHVVRAFLDCIAARDFDAALGLSDDRYEILQFAASGNVAFLEVVDEFNLGGRRITMHWAGVWEIDDDDRITDRRDYWDANEFEAQLG